MFAAVMVMLGFINLRQVQAWSTRRIGGEPA